jgi:hypothetical protein
MPTTAPRRPRPRLSVACAGVVAATWLATASTARAEPTVAFTEYLGPFTGDGAPMHPANLAPKRAEYFGTDLGFSYAHGGQIHFLFGDTSATEAYAPIEASTGGDFDDAFGTVDLAEWSDASQISRERIPLVRLGQNPGTTEVSAIDPGHVMALGQTPIGGFSNGTREFGLFNIGKPEACRADADCDGALTCDVSLGYLGARATDEAGLTLACRDGSPGCNADTLLDATGNAVAESGFCVDETSSVGADPVSHLLTTAAINVLIGLRDTEDPRRYVDSRRWLTSKFINVAARTVQDFSPERGGEGQDYRPADASGAARRVFLWGRPSFIGVRARQRNLALYFAYVDLPAGAGYTWEPQYFAGLVDGRPVFSRDQTAAVPLDLDATQAGVQAEEPIDVVNQLSVAWVAPLGKWVMFYGGGMSRLPTAALPQCGVLQLFSGSECIHVDVGNGAVRMRTAADPWGPWSPPQDVIAGGDPALGAVAQYAPGGALRHPACRETNCAPHMNSPHFSVDEYGFFYAANIVEQWITPVSGGVDILWNASTWNPYRVVLLRTRLQR